jgi:hypothetical protein
MGKKDHVSKRIYRQDARNAKVGEKNISGEITVSIESNQMWNIRFSLNSKLGYDFLKRKPPDESAQRVNLTGNHRIWPIEPVRFTPQGRSSGGLRLSFSYPNLRFLTWRPWRLGGEKCLTIICHPQAHKKLFQ